MVEEWKAVVYEDGFISQKYIVSDMGRIYNKVKGCLYDGSINSGGYKMVYLNEPGLSKPIRILKHRIVALAFIPNPANLDEVNHKDGNKTNNKVENLEWITHRDNILHAHRTGLCKNTDTIYKLTDLDIKNIRDDYIKSDFTNIKDYAINMCNQLNVSKSGLKRILCNITRYNKEYSKVVNKKHENGGVKNKKYKRLGHVRYRNYNISKLDANLIRNNYEINNIRKMTYCRIVAEKYNTNENVILNILNNVTRYNPYYKPNINRSLNTDTSIKLNEQNVLIIRDNCPDVGIKKYIADMSSKYGVSKGTLYDVIYGHSWKDVGGKIRKPKNQGSLSVDDVVEIRKAFKNKSSDLVHKRFCEIWADKKQVSVPTIQNVIYYRSFKDIKI